MEYLQRIPNLQTSLIVRIFPEFWRELADQKMDVLVDKPGQI